MKRIGLTDFAQVTSLSVPKLSPSGTRLTFFTHKADQEQNSYQTKLCLMENGAVRQLHQAARGNYLWLEEDLLLHVGQAGKQRTEFVTTNVVTGESKTLFCVPFPASIIGRIRPELYLLRGMVNVIEQQRIEGLSGAELEAEWSRIEEERQVCEVFDEYPFWQNGAGVVNKDRAKLYLYDTAQDKLTCITGEMFDVESVAFCESSGQIVYNGVEFTTMRPMLNGVYRYDLKNGTTTCLLPQETMEVRDMAFVGETLVLTACSHKGKTIAQMLDLHTMDLTSGEMSLLYAGELSFGNPVGTDCRYAESPAFLAYEDKVYFIAGVEESAHLMCCDLNGQVSTVIGGDGTVDGFALANGRLVCVAMKDMRPQELYELTSQRELVKISGFNDEYCSEHEIVWPQRVRFKNREGNEIHGMVLVPPDHHAGESCPAILNIHGGPRAAYGEIFYHEMQYWASEGYYVMFCNPTGSLGRGQYFGDVCGKSGQIDYLDIMDFVDQVLERYPDIDKDRLGVTGGSYGGFMTNWIIGHTDRFAAAASQRSTANNISNEATTGNGMFFTKSCLKAGEERSVELLWDQSPLKYIDNAVTPTLFIHALEDYCCYHVEALQMYTALQRLGVETRLCLFKGENHSLSRTGRPRGRVRRLQEITQWMDAHLKHEVR